MALTGTGAVLGLAAAALVVFARPNATPNRLLGGALLFAAFAELAAGGALLALLGSGDPLMSSRVFLSSMFTMLALYLLFIGTLPTRFGVPFRGPGARLGIGLAWLGLMTLALVQPAPLRDDGWLRFLLVPVLAPLVMLYGLIVAVSMWRTAPAGSLRRRQGLLYMLAFGVRDLAIVFFGAVVILSTIFSRQVSVTGWIPPVGNLVFPPLIAYGILSGQLFDIDLKVKFALKGGTVGAALAIVFFGVSEAVEAVAATGGALFGFGAAAGVALLFYPLRQRIDARLSRTLMPRVQDTSQYRRVRARELYEAALRDALQDGEIRAKERAMLRTLQDGLRLDAADTEALEARLVAASLRPGAEMYPAEPSAAHPRRNP